MFQFVLPEHLKQGFGCVNIFSNFFGLPVHFSKSVPVQISKSDSDEHCLSAHGLFDENDLAIFLLICITKLQILVQMCYIHTPLVQLFNMAYQLYNTGYFQHLCFWNKDLLMQKYTTYSEFELYGYKPEHFPKSVPVTKQNFEKKFTLNTWFKCSGKKNINTS